MYGYIYKRENLLNHKIYIGQHLYQRDEVTLDPNYKGSGKLLKEAFRKYGEEAFTYELIDYADDPQTLNEKEIYWIAKYDCLSPKGYNILLGGQILFPEEQRHERASIAAKARGTGWHHKEETRKKIAQSNTNYHHTQEAKDKMSKSKMGNTSGRGNKDTFWITDGINNYRLHKGEPYDTTKFKLGKTWSKETKIKLKENYLGKTCVHKDDIIKWVLDEEVDTYLNDGYLLGKGPAHTKDKGTKISNSKKGAIKIVNDLGKVKYIQPQELEYYEAQGFHRPVCNKKH